MAKTKKAKAIRFVKVAALPIKQHDKTMYAFVLLASQLRKICTVSRREEDDEKGYQRHLKEIRLRQIARYVDNSRGVIPNNIIVNFFSDQVTFTKGKLRLPSNKVCAWVIDGQHRLFGFSVAKSDYPLLVVAFVGLEIKQQVELFSVINTQQKKLPTSLALDLLKFVGDPAQDLETRCRELVAQLNDETDSPWRQRVNMTGEGVGAISLVNFVRKLKPILDTGGVLHPFPFDAQYGAIENYWNGIKAVYAEQWNEKGSLLGKTLGFGALMNIFPTVFNLTLTTKKGSFTVANIIDMFKHMKDFKFDSETLGSGSGNKAEMAAGQTIEDELKQAINAGSGNQTVLKLKD